MPFFHKLIVSALSIVIYALIGGTSLELIFAFALILLIGIPHGATDYLLVVNMRNNSIDKLKSWKFILSYLAIMAVYALLWYLFKSFAFALFILISAYHFGEAQLVNSGLQGMTARLSHLLWGFTVLIILFSPHMIEMKSLVVPYLISPSEFHFFESNYLYILAVLVICTLSLLYTGSKKQLLVESANLMLLFIIAYNTSLLLGFAIFFTFWHSYDATLFQVLKLKRKENNFSIVKWLKAAAPYTILSWMGIVTIVLGCYYLEINMPSITLFFVLVSLITLPHVLVMSRFYAQHES